MKKLTLSSGLALVALTAVTGVNAAQETSLKENKKVISDLGSPIVVEKEDSKKGIFIKIDGIEGEANDTDVKDVEKKKGIFLKIGDIKGESNDERVKKDTSEDVKKEKK